jgi:hypothetical protein
MAMKTIETKAVISAEDRTGQTFAAVSAKMKGLEQTAARAGERVKASVWVAQQSAEKARLAGQAAGAARGHVGAAGGAVLALGAGVITAALTAETIRALAVAIGERVSERTRTALAGYSPAEQKAMESRAAELSRKYPSLGQNQIMALQREAGTIVPRADVDKAMDPLLQFATIYQAQGKSVEDMISVLRSSDLQGVTSNLEAFTGSIGDLAKAANAFGGSVKPNDILAFSMYARGATPGLSREFIGGVAPSLIQKMGGAPAGTAVGSIYQSLVGGTRRKASTEEMKRFGLLEPSGEVKGLSLAKSDPYRWVNEVMLPGMRSQGITSKEDILTAIPKLFQRSTQQQAVGIMATQQADIERDRASIGRAMGLEAADYAKQHDASLKMTAVTTQAAGLLGTLGAKAEGATGALGLLAGALGDLNIAAHDMSNLKAAVIGVTAGLVALEIGLIAAAAAANRFGFAGAAGALGGAAGMLGRAGGMGAAGYGLYKTIQPQPLNAGENELMRQKLYAPELRNPAPMEKLRANLKPVQLGAGMLSPPDKVSVKTKIEGEANLNVKMQIGLDPGLIAREVEKQTSNGMGVSMSP